MADRVSTLSIVGQLDLTGARQAFEQFRAEILSSPVNIGTGGGAPTGRGFTFGGQSSTTGQSPFVSTASLVGGINGQSGNLFTAGTGGTFNVGGGGAAASFNLAATTFAQAVASFQSAVASMRVGSSGTTFTRSRAAISGRGVLAQQDEEAEEIASTISAPAAGGGRAGGGRGGGGSDRVGGLLLGRLRQYATVGFALMETSRVANAYSGLTQGYFEARGNPLGEIAAERQFQQSLGSTPLVGGIAQIAAEQVQRVASGVAHAYNQAGGGLPGVVAGISGFWNPGEGASEAESNARRSMDITQLRSASILETRRIGHQGDEYQYQANALRETDPYARQISEIRGRRLAFQDHVSDEATARQQGIANELDPGKRAELENSLKQWQEAVKRSEAAFNKLSDEQENAARTEQRIGTASIVLGTTASQYQRAGYSAGAAIARARQGIAQYQPNFDAAGNITSFGNIDESTPEGKERAKAVRDAYGQNVIEGRDAETRRTIGVQGSIESSRLARGGKSLEAEINDIRADAAAKRVGVSSGARLAEIFDERKEREATVTQRFERETQGINATLSAQSLGLQSALRREPGAVGQAFTIGAAGLNDALGLKDRPDARHASEQNTILALHLLSQQYFDSFRGVQADPRSATQGGRQSENPQSVIEAIDKATEKFIQGVKDAFHDVVDNG